MNIEKETISEHPVWKYITRKKEEQFLKLESSVLDIIPAADKQNWEESIQKGIAIKLSIELFDLLQEYYKFLPIGEMRLKVRELFNKIENENEF